MWYELMAWTGFVAGIVVLWAYSVKSGWSPSPEEKERAVDLAYGPEYRNKVDALEKALEAATTKYVSSPYARLVPTCTDHGFGFVELPTPKAVSVQEQLDNLYSHLGLELQYEAGTEAKVVLTKTKRSK